MPRRKKHRRRKTNNNTTSNLHVLERTNEDESKIEKTQDGIDINTSGLPVFDYEDVFNSSLLFECESNEETGLPPYDHVTNYLSPRPKFLWYDPNRHRKIISRIENFSRIMTSDSSDDEMPVLEDESEPNVDRSVKETEEIVDKSVGNCKEHEEDDEEFDEFGDDDKWNVLLKYLIVMVAVILTTLMISSMNSPPVSQTESIHWFNVSETKGEPFGPMMLMAECLNDREIDKGYKKRDKSDLTATAKELVAMQHEKPEDKKVVDLETVEIVKKNEVQPVILISEKIKTLLVEDENKVYIQLLRNLDSSNVNEESEILKPVVNEDDGNKKRVQNDLNLSAKDLVTLQHEQHEDYGNENTNTVTKLAYFGAVFGAFSAIAVVIFVSMSVLYCLMHSEVFSRIGYINEVIDESGSVGSFCSKSSILSEYYDCNKDASSSNQTTYFDFQQSSADSTSHGSFTVEKKIVKKQRSKTQEEMMSTVRRSSLIHNRSISSP